MPKVNMPIHMRRATPKSPDTSPVFIIAPALGVTVVEVEVLLLVVVVGREVCCREADAIPVGVMTPLVPEVVVAVVVEGLETEPVDEANRQEQAEDTDAVLSQLNRYVGIIVAEGKGVEKSPKLLSVYPVPEAEVYDGQMSKADELCAIICLRQLL